MAEEKVASAIPQLVSDDPRITVGRFTYGQPRFRIWTADERIEIGAFCSIADNVTIFAGGEHNAHWVTTFPLRIALSDPLAGKDGHPATKGATSIGNDVWIGDGAMILSGVRIGDGAIIGAGSVVTRSVPQYSVVAGNPARVIRQRFSDEQVTELMSIQWWQWDIERIRENLPLLCGATVAQFIATVKREGSPI